MEFRIFRFEMEWKDRFDVKDGSRPRVLTFLVFLFHDQGCKATFSILNVFHGDLQLTAAQLGNLLCVICRALWEHMCRRSNSSTEYLNPKPVPLLPSIPGNQDLVKEQVSPLTGLLRLLPLSKLSHTVLTDSQLKWCLNWITVCH